MFLFLKSGPARTRSKNALSVQIVQYYSRQQQCFLPEPGESFDLHVLLRAYNNAHTSDAPSGALLPAALCFVTGANQEMHQSRWMTQTTWLIF
jgi:hypothetical protein